MCLACGLPEHVPTIAPDGTATSAPVKFAALHHPDFRLYFSGAMLSMMADYVEHVITYWVLWEDFHSPELAGFAVVSHWLPALLFSVYFGSLADRYDCRKVIQAAQLLFMCVSALWGILFLSGSLQMWHAMVLLVLHGCASALWAPAEQLMIHDIVGTEELPSAVRLNSIARNLGILLGPAVGTLLLFGLGPTWGIFTNIAIYLPLTLWMIRAPYTGHIRDEAAGIARRPRVSLLDTVQVMRQVRRTPALVGMIVLGGISALFIGTILQPAMPAFAQDFGVDQAGLAYGILLAANAAGAVVGGLLLEATRLVRVSARWAIVSTLVWAASTVGFALTHDLTLALILLVVGGAGMLGSQAISQTIVQLLAPAEMRGRVVGVYNQAATGLRAGSGLMLGLFGGLMGIHVSVALSAGALVVGTLVLLALTERAEARLPAVMAPPAQTA